MELPTLTHAFTFGERRVFLGEAEAEQVQKKTLQWEPVRIFREFHSNDAAFILNAAFHLFSWYAKHHFCGACGGVVHPAPVERALVCEQCGFTIYPTISPAIIVAITDEDRILLARNAHGTFRHYSLIAGYIEVGETLEQAVRREVHEEVGISVKDIRYMGSQPWGLSQSLMIAFHATLDGSPEIVLQESELAEAIWFTRAELPTHPNLTSIAFEMIEKFRNGLLDTCFLDLQS